MSIPEEKQVARRWQFGECVYFELSRRLVVRGKDVHLENKLLDLLLHLLEYPGKTVEKGDLLERVWPDTNTTDQNLMVAVSKLRKALGGERDSMIRNVSGVGYKMVVPVHVFTVEQPGRPAFTLEVGDAIPYRPNWRAVRKLSSNPQSPVWLAEQEKNGEQRVYKFANDGVRLRALQREVVLYRLLTKGLADRADFVVRILDWQFEAGPFFTESEFCGPNLLEWSELHDFRQTSAEERLRIALDMTQGMALAHSLAIFHNDLKPGNVMLMASTVANETRHVVKLGDFGVASLQDPGRLLEFDISDQGVFTEGDGALSGPVGTAMYRAPELHAGGLPTAAGDVYALGVLLYQIVSGKFHESPSPGWEAKIADTLLREDIRDAAQIDPSKRISTVAELAGRLERLEDRREQSRLQERTEKESEQVREALARTRMRRPWVVLTICSLLFAVLVMLWSVHRAVKNEQEADRRNATLESMYGFLATDLLGQSNPFLEVAGSRLAGQQTLVSAMATAIPQIDGRFLRQPAIAGRLHETMAESFKSRSRFSEADQEYARAAQRFRTAEGQLSQQGLLMEFKREFLGLSSGLPGSLEAARKGFEQQQAIFGRIAAPSTELQAWKTIVQVGLIGMGPHPGDGLPMLTAAVQHAEATPNFDFGLLIQMKKLFCGTYVRLGDGPNLESSASDLIALLTRLHGPSSPTLLVYQMYLEEAYYLEARYPETIAQGTANFARFSEVLGSDNQLTLSTLSTRAAAEGQLEQYGDAERDDLLLYNAARLVHPDKRIEEGSLADAALFECRRGEFATGLEHARQVMRETGPGPLSQPMFFEGSHFIVAECLIAREETASSGSRAKNAPGPLAEAERILQRINYDAIKESQADTSHERAGQVALARLALLRHDYTQAGRYVAKAEPYFSKRDADPYERKALQVVKMKLAQQIAP